MTLRSFITGLAVTFSVPLLLVVVVPYFTMNSIPPVKFDEAADGKTDLYFPKRTGRVADGAAVYAANGCYQCHSQLIRPTYAGADMWRSDWAGLAEDPDRGDTRRETNAFDYQYEKYAQIGVNRLGPDLSNIGTRVAKLYAKDTHKPESWLYVHLYNPKSIPDREWSTCPSFRFLFEEKKVQGQPHTDALPFATKPGFEIVPTPQASALVSYLMSMKKDDAVPASMNYGPKKEAKDAAKPAAPAAKPAAH